MQQPVRLSAAPAIVVLLMAAMLIGPISIFAQETIADAETAAASAEITDEELPETDDEETLPDPYAELLAKAETQEGVFDIHQVDGSWYWEIPVDLLDRDLFWYAEIAGAPADYLPQLANNQIASRMVRAERRYKSDILDVYDLTAPLKKRDAFPAAEGEEHSSSQKVNPVQIALGQSAVPPILLSLPIVAEGPEGSIVVDVSAVFATAPAGFDPTNNLALSGVQVVAPVLESSFISEMTAYPDNVDVVSYLTFLRTPNPLSALDLSGPSTNASVELRHSITLLPETPMLPRYHDPRVGYFTVGFDDYSGEDASGIASREYITRYYLQKKDPNAEISDPVEPIVYYIGPEVPEKWRPYFKQAVEDWQVAFEEAGFSNAIIAKDPPSLEEDPNWSPFDTRYSVIRWLAQPIANAQGPHIHDPRTGEILAAHVLIWADVADLAQQWYFAQVAGHNESLRTLPLDDELMGEIMRYIVSHEVGHTLGLRHNHRASQIYDVDQLRDPDFTAAHGTSPSIMSYGRFNYIAQPEDGVTNYFPAIGPYDRFAIEWGYKPIQDALSPEAEIPTLDEWAARQLDEPTLAFATDEQSNRTDPNVLSENLGSDRVEAARLGIQNLERIMAFIVEATTETGGNFSELQKTYNTLLDQRLRWLKSAAILVGGVEETRTMAGRGDAQFHRVSPERQRAAVAFLMQNLATPDAFLDAEVLDLLTPTNAIDGVQGSQVQILDALLSPAKYNQLLDAEAIDPPSAYTLAEFLDDIQAGLFNEYRADVVSVDPIRRELQRHYISTLADQMSPASDSDGELDASNPLAALLGGVMPSPTGDLRGAATFNLAQLRETLRTASLNAGNVNTQLHILDLISQIDGVIGDTLIEFPALASAENGPPTESTEVTYFCEDDVTIDATFDHENDTATVVLPDGTLTLPHVVSGSGAKYSDETTTFWTKGGEAFVQVDGETTISGCHAGQEPSAGEESDVEADAANASPAPVVEATYLCADDVTIDAVYDNEARTVTVMLPDGVLELPQAESASGARYSDGTTTFWSKGDEAFVEVDDEIIIQDCVAED